MSLNYIFILFKIAKNSRLIPEFRLYIDNGAVFKEKFEQLIELFYQIIIASLT
jgi:hypothetical protein